MKNIFISTLLISFISCSSPEKNPTLKKAADTTAQQEMSQDAEPFAVVELFSSEGCSDCPAAEEVLNKITKNAMADKSYIYPLAFHVDYWNKLGWKDSFGDSAYSNRQRKYRTAFGNEVVYTPQMIVNGEKEFVGSDEHKADSAITVELKKIPSAYFTIHPTGYMGKNGEYPVEYEILQMPEGNLSDYNFCLALVERNLVTNITRGENKGKTLKHENVVRSFISVNLKDKKGEVKIPLRSVSITKNNSLIAFIQQKEKMKIIGANLWNF